MRAVCLWVLWLGACSVERHFEFGPPKGPIAVGGSGFGAAASETCRRGERGSYCDFNHVDLQSLTTVPAGIFATAQAATAGTFTARALTAGTAKFVVVANDGLETKTFEASVTALAINDIRVAPVNERGEPCTAPLLYSTAANVYVPFELRHDTTVLTGSAIYPFTATGAALAASQIYERKLALTMPTVAGTAALTSNAAPGFALAIQVFAASDVQALQIGDPAQPITTKDYNGALIAIDLSVGGRPACDDSLPRTVSVSTPEQCTLSINSTERKPTFTLPGLSYAHIHGLKAGTCTFTAALDGTAVTATKSFTIGP